MTKNLKEYSCAYLKSWLDSLRESPQFIKTTLLDVKRASSMISQQIDKVALEMGQSKEVAEEITDEVVQSTSLNENQSVYYSSVAFLQTSDAT